MTATKSTVFGLVARGSKTASRASLVLKSALGKYPCELLCSRPILLCLPPLHHAKCSSITPSKTSPHVQQLRSRVQRGRETEQSHTVPSFNKFLLPRNMQQNILKVIIHPRKRQPDIRTIPCVQTHPRMRLPTISIPTTSRVCAWGESIKVLQRFPRTPRIRCRREKEFRAFERLPADPDV